MANESIKVLLDLRLSRLRVDRNLITVPILIIGAGQDKVIHPSVFEDIAEFYGTQATLVILENLGHFCPFEAGWELTAKVIEEWLKLTKKK